LHKAFDRALAARFPPLLTCDEDAEDGGRLRECAHPGPAQLTAGRLAGPAGPQPLTIRRSPPLKKSDGKKPPTNAEKATAAETT